MTLSNKLIYGDRLKCGSEDVAKRCLVLPDRGFLREGLHAGGNLEMACGSGDSGSSCWMEALMAER